MSTRLERMARDNRYQKLRDAEGLRFMANDLTNMAVAIDATRRRFAEATGFRPQPYEDACATLEQAVAEATSAMLKLHGAADKLERLG